MNKILELLESLEKLFHIFIRGKENGIEDVIIHEGGIIQL